MNDEVWNPVKNDLFLSFKEAFDALQADTAGVLEHAEQLVGEIQKGKFIPSEVAEALSVALEGYKKKLQAFREAGNALAIDTEAGIEPVRHAILEYESRQKMIAERQLVLDYLKLSTKVESVIAQLEESKQLLMKVCRGERPRDELQPFGLVVENVKAGVVGLPDKIYDAIESQIGRSIARATDRGDLSIDESMELSEYLDGSCELLSPNAAASPSGTEGDLPPQPSPAEPESLPLWDAFDGFINAAPSIPDISEIQFNAEPFSDVDILPDAFAQIADHPSEVFLLRVRLIKCYIHLHCERKEGLNLICMEDAEDYPYACWAERGSKDSDELIPHYVAAGLFTQGAEREEVYRLRRMIASNEHVAVTIVALSESDREQLANALDLADLSASVRFAVLSANALAKIEVEEIAPKNKEQAEPAAVPAITLSARNKIKNAKPGANSFLSDLDKSGSPRDATELVTMLSYFGVIPESILLPLSKLAFGIKDEEEEKRAVAQSSVLKSLESRGVIAAYVTNCNGAEDVLYCFTQYGYSCIHKASVVQAIKRRSKQRIGSCKYVGLQEMDRDDLQRMCLRTVSIYQFLSALSGWIEVKEFSNIISSLETDESCACRIELPCEGEWRRLRVVLPDEYTEDCDQLILAGDKTADLNWEPENAAEGVLLFRSSSVYCRTGEKWRLLYGEESDPDGTQSGRDTELQDESSAKAAPAPEAEESDSGSPDQAAIGGDPAEPTAPTDQTEALFDRLLHEDKPSDEQLVCAVRFLLSKQTVEDAEDKRYGALANALMLARAASFNKDRPLSISLFGKLLAATGTPLEDFDYTGEELSALFDSDDKFDEPLRLAAFSLAMFAPQKAYDYTLDGVSGPLVEDYDHFFPSYPKYKGLFRILNEIRKVVPEGFSNRVIGLLGDQAERQSRINRAAAKARDLIEAPSPNTTGLPGHRETLNECFGPDSVLGAAIRSVAEGRLSDRAFIEEVYQEYCKENGKISQSKIDEAIEEVWRKNRKHRTGLISKARTQVDNAFWDRLTVLKEWLDADYDSSQLDAAAVKNLRSRLVAEIDKVLPTLRKVPQESMPAVLYWMLQSIKAKLEIKEPLRLHRFFSGILFTGIISMDDNGLPILDREMDAVKYYEPWRNVIRHTLTPQADSAAVAEAISLNPDSPLHDNYRQLRMLGVYYKSDSDEYLVDMEDIQRAKVAADASEKEFRQELENAYTYDRIGEADKERILALLDYKEFFYAREDFGCWRGFLYALGLQLSEIAETRRTSLQNRLERAKESLAEGDSDQLLRAAGEQLEKKYYSLAEEYLNRFDAGERELSPETNLLRNEEKTFEEFISPEIYNPIYSECSKKTNKGGNFRTFAKNYIAANFPSDWTSRYKEDARDLIGNWPIAKQSTTKENIEILLRLLGLDVQNVDKVKNSGKVEHYKATVRSSPRNKADYQHPISAFGTKIKNPVNVLVLFGKNDPGEIVSKVNNLNLGSNTIVFIDYPLSLNDRRLVAEYFHRSTSGQNTFLLIDQVLAIFLALKTSNERLPAMLKCTLPFTRYQPFVRDGGATSDDMFCGRVSELQTILDPQGACVVYGGRQLGKTALLQRAESLRSKPEDRHYAVYTVIYNLVSEAATASKIVEDINMKTNLRLAETDSLKDLASQISMRFKDGSIRSLLLLIDEADSFLDSISNTGYHQLQPLVDLKRETQNDFKFVLAGLHNVCRTRNATDRNGVFGQLGMPLCIKPLSGSDALQLISRPLMYLGFQVDRYPHLETILTNTNYYPGILQFFGYMLVQSVPSQYGEYFSATNGDPPFALEEKQLSAIMTSNDLNNSIKEKFRLSLKLDKRYFMLARVIAILYYEHDVPETSRDGFSKELILENAIDFGIHCLEDNDVTSIGNLLDEMVEMGILTRIEDTGGYCLRRRSFLNIIGLDSDSLLDEISAENEEDV